ncbi:ABC transporter permease [Maribellus maritimus]|uniref:ABC transporter permease n=1 Tax=Maribellus maritimus TaxID=2870838 RepID=UPI001EEA96F9|nr:ABC transporter permease [Maribellus maritimus]MCG6188034.1 ABC transporter permease [Maribellus maritimus]
MNTFINNILRVVRKNKLDFFLNLVGLSVAMIIFIFVSLYVENEVTYDNYHPDANRIFRLTTSLTSPSGQTTDMALANPPFAQILKNSCPEIEDFTCVETEGGATLKFGENEYKNINVRAATPSIFKLFAYPALMGNPSEFLKSPNTIVLTEKLAKNILGDLSPLGQKITIDKKDYQITGVIKDLPTNTDLRFSALIPSDFDGIGELVDWGEYFVYFKMTSANVTGLKRKIEKLTDEKYADLLKEIGGFKLVHHLQPLQSIHFDNSLLADSLKGNKTTVYAFSVVALLILIIAGINYNNLTLAQLEKREHEFNIRKTIGCGKRWIYYHIISESVLNVFFAAVISIGLASLLFPMFNQLFEKNFDLSSVIRIAIPIVGFFVAFGVMVGLYPAFKTTKVSSVKKQGFGLFCKTLVTFQNAVAIVMIAGLFMIWSQIRFMKNAELGFNKEQLMAVSIPPEPEKFPGKEVIRQEFSALPEVKSMAFGGGGTNLGSTSNWMKAIMAVKDDNGDDVQFVLNQPQIDENYIDLFGIEMVEGRNFSRTNSNDKDKSVIINQAYVKAMGWSNPVGKILDETPPQKIIGVVKDFHFDALNNPIEPLKFELLEGQPSYVFLRAELKNVKVIQKKWENLFPDEPFEFRFMDQHMAGLYRQNEKDMTVFSWLTLVAILISCLGLYGLASHFIINRTKEIGIRKVNGAKVSEVISLLNKGFIRWVLIAFVVATPVAWGIMQKWLENFAYKTTLSWWIFALAGVMALGIALLTVSWQSWRAATRNPVEALRYE